ncbi:MAG: AAA family ATPase, partial [Paracoccaceae bacterium]
MSRYVQKKVVDQAEQTSGRLFRLPRRVALEDELSMLFSSHLGRMRSGAYFESEVLLVTGKSGAGKTTEIESMIKDFNSEQIALPSGQNARLASCELDRKGNWKALGRKTLKSIGYPVSDKARLTQAEIWDRVFQQGEMQGCVGLNYDELQHILADKEGEALEEELDSFKSILKSKSWP